MDVYSAIFALLMAIFTAGARPADAIKCHPYKRVCIKRCKEAHGGNIFMRNMCIGGCKFTQCVLKRTDDSVVVD